MYLKAILVFLSLLLLAYLIYYLGFYKSWSYGCVGTISFESFKAMITIMSSWPTLSRSLSQKKPVDMVLENMKKIS